MIRSLGQCYCFLGIITISYFFCFLFPNTFASSPTSILCRRDQRDALLELQKEFSIHTDEDHYATTTSWNKSVDCCSWEGIRCDTILGVVISLRLWSNSTATLKSSSGLFKLQHLTHLDLSQCRLQGEIPSSIGNLSRLTSLDLSRFTSYLFRPTSLDLSANDLVGQVPASIGTLNQLEFMDLSFNGLKGNIPTSFANLTKLSILNLSGNQFTGGLVLSNLTSLSIIDLSSNHFQSSLFVVLSGLRNLEEFHGYGNSFVGPFPSSLFMIPSLVEIDLSGNQFEGPLEFGNTSSSSKLRELFVGENNFDGFFPESILKLRNLEYLELSYNNFRGKIPRSISTLCNLRDLRLSHNNFGGQVPRSISKLNLHNLELSYNKLEGQVPLYLWRWSHLKYIFLSHNSFCSFDNSKEVIDGSSLDILELGSNSLQGPIPQWICKLRSLSVLDFSNNHFTGSIPQCFESFTYISDLYLRNNSLSGFIPDVFFNIFKLRSLDLSRNNFVGKLPKSLIKCKNMEFFNVKGNKIKDTFPIWFSSLQNLKVLVLGSNAFYGSMYNSSAYLGFPSMRIIDISNNNFVGSLPQDYFTSWHEMSLEWRNNPLEGTYMRYVVDAYLSIDLAYKGVDTEFAQISTALKAIDFSGNRFCGHIPKSIGLLSDLRLLNLSGNIFTGNIPPSLVNITKLETLDVSRNNLTGEIPQGLGKLSFLSNINFSYNHLEGLVPQSTQFGTQKCSSFVGNPELYGLEKICGEIHHVPVPTSEQPEESLSEPEEQKVNWIAAAIAFGPSVFCGLVIGHIFTSSWRYAWLRAKLRGNKS